MAEELLLQLVEVTFIGAPPARQVDCALAVSEVQVDAQVLRSHRLRQLPTLSRGLARSQGNQPQVNSVRRVKTHG